MTFADIQSELRKLKLNVELNNDGALKVVGNLRQLTPELKNAVKTHKEQFRRQLRNVESREPEKADDYLGTVNRFFDRSLSGNLRGTFKLGGQTYEYWKWDGAKLSGKLIAFDTETAAIQGTQVPELALATAYNGEVVALIHPGDLAAFISKHAEATLICHNVGFDYSVVREHLLRNQRDEQARLWDSIVDQGRMADSMLMEQLITIARGEDFPRKRDLAMLAKTWTLIDDLDKEDPYRKRYAEIIGKDWTGIDSGFLEYAAKDPVATYELYLRLRDKARLIAKENGVDRLARKRNGLLTQKVQIKAACALSYVEKHGLCLDATKREEAENRIRSDIERLVADIEAIPGVHGIFKILKKTGKYQLTKSGAPSVSQKRALEMLTKIADENDIAVPTTKQTKKPTLSRKFWKQHVGSDPFIDLWMQLDELTKLNQFFPKLRTETIYPRYNVVIRSGRASCHDPNIQQIPRNSQFRELFVASPGHVFLIIDYSALELRTLAAVCEERFGGSQLGDTIRQGVDPHVYTAALLLAMEIEEFKELKQTDPDRFKQARQQAKALNFGLPGGLAAPALVDYAKSTYGVDMSLQEATDFRERFLTEIYPEIGEYLEVDYAKILARNLHTTRKKVRSVFDTEPVILAAKRVTRGRPHKRDGTPYRPGFVDRIWEGLYELNQNPKLSGALESREANEWLERQLFCDSATTLTGRVRGSTSYTQRCNNAFQGLAADGAKLALWELHKAGYRIVAFIHDEFVIELPQDSNHTEDARRIDQTCCQAMQQLTGTIPIECEYALCYRWSKDAEARFENKRLVPWKEESDKTQATKNRLAPLLSSNKCEWETPQEFFDDLDREFRFTLDVCALSENAKCKHYFTPEQDGLQQKWTGVCWMNPPYGRKIAKWMKKAYESSLDGATVICLVPARPDTKWWNEYAKKGEVRFVEGRLKFGGSPNSAPFPSAVVVFRGDRRRLKPQHVLLDPLTEVHVGDCREVLPKIDCRPHLIFADPPFNIGEEYGDWNDKLPWGEYVQFTYEWIDCCLGVLADDGAIWIHVPDEIVAEIMIHLKGKGLTLRRKGIWHFRFGQCNNSNFIRSHENWVYFVKDPNRFRWNPDEILVDSDRATTYGDKRTQTTQTPGKRVPFDVVGIPSDGQYWGRVQGNNTERRPKHENQLPEVYLARVIKALSNAGDLVLDPFAGSGTTATVARALKRQCITVEYDPDNAASAFERIQNGPKRDIGQHASSS